jgi:hypothetical protein
MLYFLCNEKIQSRVFHRKYFSNDALFLPIPVWSLLLYSPCTERVCRYLQTVASSAHLLVTAIVCSRIVIWRTYWKVSFILLAMCWFLADSIPNEKFYYDSPKRSNCDSAFVCLRDYLFLLVKHCARDFAPRIRRMSRILGLFMLTGRVLCFAIPSVSSSCATSPNPAPRWTTTSPHSTTTTTTNADPRAARSFWTTWRV